MLQADDLYELLTFWQVLNDLTEHNKQLLDELDAEAQLWTPNASRPKPLQHRPNRPPKPCRRARMN